MKQTLAILKQYWGYEQFRPLQEDIIDATLAGEDVLALMPTGGGKSICFQVPALVKEGLCIVITPLIALMQDQVAQLQSRGIKAEAIFSGMKKREIDIKLDNCIYGDVKFLYISPERLETEIFKERVVKMNVSLLAVDEAHCISQWGYDFRPAYLKIAEITKVFPELNIIVLTATATPKVVKDIQQKLLFHKENVFQKSFARANLSYSVRYVEDKEAKLLEVLRNVPGPGIVYVSTRKAAKDVAYLLLKNGISADFYHEGLPHHERSRVQEKWVQNQTRIVVATNAFGMGIDKPDVRVVVHQGLTQDLESYYQEAGRAGRDEAKAYAVILFNEADVEELKHRVDLQYPSVDYLKQVYQALANYYKLAIGSGAGQSFDFDIKDFSENYKLHHLQVFYALKKMEDEGLLAFNESYYHPSQLHIPIDHTELYKFQVAYSQFDPVVKALLRLYGGEMFGHFVSIAEYHLAKFMNIPGAEVVSQLTKLDELGIIVYNRQKDIPQVVFTLPRQDPAYLSVNKAVLQQREQLAKRKVASVIQYVKHQERCRTALLLEYFGEDYNEKCGICDTCIRQKKKQEVVHVDRYHQLIDHLLVEGPLLVEDIMEKINPTDRDTFLQVIRDMVDRDELKYDELWRLYRA